VSETTKTMRPKRFLSHARGERLREPERRLDVDRLDVAPAGQVELGEVRLVEGCGGMDQHVDPPMALEQARRGALNLALLGEVDGRLCVEVQDLDGVAAVAQVLRYSPADRSRAAGHRGYTLHHSSARI
jgi:hypothetical protein